MKLISLKIKGFKNLDFWENQIYFIKSEGISIFVGNNGSGKSNVLEAISAIFYWLYDVENFEKKCPFQFILIYKINENTIRIKYKFSTINQIEFFKNGKKCKVDVTLLPSKIIALYSGEETRLYEEYFKKSSEKMIFIDKNYWNIALLTMFFSITNFDNTDLIYKGLQNIIGNGIIINEIYLNQNKISFIDFKLMELNRDEVYKYLKRFKNIELTFNNGINTKDLSEGQKKQILIFFATNFLADKDSIVLLDEPDSYIHVGNKQRLKEFFDDFLNITKEGEFIMTTHSPTLMNKFDKKHLFYLENGKLDDKNKAEILKEIAGDTMSYTEQQIVLNTTKDIIIVEGKTDEIYIKTALEKLKEDNSQYKDLDFEFLLMGGSDYEILKRFSEQFPAKQGQKIMAFFDNDQAGFNCIKNALGEENLQKNTFNSKKLKDIYVNFYPKKNGFSQSNFEIEDYFRIEKIIEFMYKGSGIQVFGDTKSKLDKNTFANECKNFDKSEFEGFKSLFDEIKRLKSLSEELKEVQK